MIAQEPWATLSSRSCLLISWSCLLLLISTYLFDLPSKLAPQGVPFAPLETLNCSCSTPSLIPGDVIPSNELSFKLLFLQNKFAKVLETESVRTSADLIELPPSMLEHFFRMAMVRRPCRGEAADAADKEVTRLKRLFLRALDGGAINFVALGGSQTRGRNWEDATVTDSWPHLVFSWLNSTFPNAKNSVLNSAVAGAGGGPPLMCLDEFVGPSPDLVMAEFDVNPTTAGEANLVFEKLLQLNTSPAVLYLALTNCQLWDCERCSQNPSKAASRPSSWAWAALKTPPKDTRRSKVIKVARLLGVPVIDFGLAMSSSAECSLSELLGAGNMTIGAPKFCNWHHWNMLGLDLIARIVIRYFISVILSISEDEVSAHLLQAPPAPGGLNRSNHRCYTTRWGFEGSPFGDDRTPLLAPSWKTDGWEFVEIRADKHVYRSHVANSTIAFRMETSGRGRLALALLESADNGKAMIVVKDSTGSVAVSHVVSGGGPEGRHMLSGRFFPEGYGGGVLDVEVTVLDGPGKVGFDLIGLFYLPCDDCETEMKGLHDDWTLG